MKLHLNPAAARAFVMSGAGRGAEAAANLLLNASRERVPVDSGRLRESGFAQVSGAQARVGYSAPYAAIVHERQVKYLEEPMNDPGLHGQMLTVFAREMRIP